MWGTIKRRSAPLAAILGGGIGLLAVTMLNGAGIDKTPAYGLYDNGSTTVQLPKAEILASVRFPFATGSSQTPRFPDGLQVTIAPEFGDRQPLTAHPHPNFAILRRGVTSRSFVTWKVPQAGAYRITVRNSGSTSVELGHYVPLLHIDWKTYGIVALMLLGVVAVFTVPEGAGSGLRGRSRARALRRRSDGYDTARRALKNGLHQGLIDEATFRTQAVALADAAEQQGTISAARAAADRAAAQTAT